MCGGFLGQHFDKGHYCKHPPFFEDRTEGFHGVLVFCTVFSKKTIPTASVKGGVCESKSKIKCRDPHHQLFRFLFNHDINILISIYKLMARKSARPLQFITLGTCLFAASGYLEERMDVEKRRKR